MWQPNKTVIKEHVAKAQSGWAEGRLPENLMYNAATCVEHSFGDDYLSDLAALEAGDVLVAMHGAACVQLFFMRRHSHLLELRPFDFDAWQVRQRQPALVAACV